MLFTATLAATTISACSSQKATVPQERKAVRTQMDRVYSDVTPHGLIISFEMHHPLPVQELQHGGAHCARQH